MNDRFVANGLLAVVAGMGTLCAAAQQSSPAAAPVNTTVIVLGAPEPVSDADSARSVTVFDSQQHPLAFQDVEDYLRSDPSVSIEQRGAAGVQSDIVLRGSSFEQTLVLLNGLRLNDVETSHFNLDVPVPLESLGAINVLHGAGSTLYGSDAIGGVVDFLTVAPQAESLRLRAGVGSFGENQQALAATALGRRWSEVLAASRDFSSGFMADRDYRSESVSTETRAASPLGESDFLLAGSDRPFGANQFYGNYNSWERTKGWFAALSQQFNAATQAAVAYRRHSDIFVLLRNAPSVYKNQHIDENWQAVVRRSDSLWRGKAGEARLFAGLEEDTDQIASNNLGDHGRNRGGGYLDLELRADRRGTLSLGLREELLSGGRRVTGPNIAGSYWLRPELKLRGNVGYGFRLGSFTDLYYSDPTTQGNANLKPESAWSYELGADWYPREKMTASLALFYSQQHDTIDYLRSSPTALWVASNLPGLHFAGIESSLGFAPARNQRIALGWSYLHGDENSLHGAQSEYVFNIPVNQATADWTLATKCGLLVKNDLVITDRYQQPGQAAWNPEPYPVWNVALAREVGRIRPYLQMTNLANTGYQEIQNVAMPGRGFIGGFEFLFTRKR